MRCYAFLTFEAICRNKDMKLVSVLCAPSAFSAKENWENSVSVFWIDYFVNRDAFKTLLNCIRRKIRLIIRLKIRFLKLPIASLIQSFGRAPLVYDVPLKSNDSQSRFIFCLNPSLGVCPTPIQEQ